ncbi:hypothetical protein PRUPE_2G003300 [Prunus persica]|uniref:Late embryogenesis abundant protein LEA-2 subgroup domain-containing protein n=1 Tax=Prunus persica TaxID=3760 RepID=A0A251Q8R3_PRUPE|nr:hypothetical protein PRUPE_2G003300 [Prunus persica]
MEQPVPLLDYNPIQSHDDQSLSATFDVSITARNPNKKIGIYYEGGSRLNVWYTGTKLCEGGLPKFYQGHRNTTQLVVQLIGQNPDASGLLSTLQQQQLPVLRNEFQFWCCSPAQEGER